MGFEECFKQRRCLVPAIWYSVLICRKTSVRKSSVIDQER